MKVLCITPWWPHDEGDGRGSFIADQVVALRSVGIDVDVLVVDPHRRRVGCDHVWFRWLPRYLAHGLEAPALALRLRLHGADLGAYDVLHCHGETIGAAVVRLRPGGPIVVTVHGETTSARAKGNARREQQVRRLARGATVVLVGAPLLRAWMDRGAEPIVIPNGFDDGTFVPSPLPDGPPWRVVSVSNLQRSKGIHLTVAAVGRLVARGVPIELDVLGEGPERASLVQAAADLGIAGQVNFHGRQPRKQVAAALRAAHVFCLPSAPEALGVAYLEACGTGRPVVGCVGQGAADVVRDAIDGLLVQPDDLDGVVDALARLFSDRSRLEGMAKATATRVHEEFPWSVNAHRLADLYQALAS